MKVIKSSGADKLSVESSVFYINDTPCAVRTSALDPEGKSTPIFLLMTKGTVKEPKTKGHCFLIPMLFISWWIENEPMRRIVAQTKDPCCRYWLRLANIKNLLVNKKGEAYIGMQYFLPQESTTYISTRSLKCLKRKSAI